MKIFDHFPRPTTLLALLFVLISAVTAFQGVSLLRDNYFVAAIFALAVQGSVFATENLLVANLSAAKPEKSVVFLFVVFLFFLFIGTGLNALLFFHVQGSMVAARNVRTASSELWAKSRTELETFRLAAQESIQKSAAETQAAITNENQKIATDRLAGLAPDISGRERLRSEKKDLDRAAAAAKAMDSIALTAPESRADADKQLTQAFRQANDVFAAMPEPARKDLAPVRSITVREPTTDFMGLFLEESSKRTPTAQLAWSLGAGTESLPFIILLVGMPGIPWAMRIRSRKQKVASLARELFRSSPALEKLGALPFRIEQLSLSGALDLVEESDAFTSDHLDLSLKALETTIEKTTGDRVQIIGLRDYRGKAIRPGEPLRPQLAEKPLYIDVVSVGSGGTR
jgi:hypothetical protein